MRGTAAAHEIAIRERDEALPLRKVISAEDFCVTTPLRSASSICSPTPAAKSAPSTRPSRASATSGSPNRRSTRRCSAARRKQGKVMVTRRNLIGGMGAAFASAVVGKAALAGLPEDRNHGLGHHAPAARRPERPAVFAGGDVERLDAALAHAPRRQGVPSGRGAGGARDRARHARAISGVTTGSRQVRRSRSWRAIACASS